MGVCQSAVLSRRDEVHLRYWALGQDSMSRTAVVMCWLEYFHLAKYASKLRGKLDKVLFRLHGMHTRYGMFQLLQCYR